MTSIQRCRVHWTGFTGSPGINTFYFTTPTDPASALHTLFDDIKALFPTAVTWSFDDSGDLISDTDGSLAGSWTGTPAASVSGTEASGEWSAATGAVMRWNTASIIAGRRLLGKTFLVPMASTKFAAGDIQATPLSTLRTAQATFLASAAGTNMLVWSRPQPGRAGSSHAVTGGTVPDLAAVLRSRRD